MQKQITLSGLILLITTIGFTLHSNMSVRKLFSVDFEVYGKVQGVFFRKYTQQEGKKLGLRGWCMNTEEGTVQGCIEGEENSIKTMKQWLKTTGSPSSRIDKCEFSNEKEIKEFSFSDFKIRR